MKSKRYHIIINNLNKDLKKSKGLKINENFNIKQVCARLLSEHPLGDSTASKEKYVTYSFGRF